MSLQDACRAGDTERVRHGTREVRTQGHSDGDARRPTHGCLALSIYMPYMQARFAKAQPRPWLRVNFTLRGTQFVVCATSLRTDPIPEMRLARSCGELLFLAVFLPRPADYTVGTLRLYRTVLCGVCVPTADQPGRPPPARAPRAHHPVRRYRIKYFCGTHVPTARQTYMFGAVANSNTVKLCVFNAPCRPPSG